MTVYVDDAHIPATVANGRAQHTSTWCHLFADTQAELHVFAARLGLRQSYFQPGPARGDGSSSPYWHYDITAGKRKQALRLGARPVMWRESIEIIREREARARRARMAGQASHAAGLAFQAGDYVKASRLLALARQSDPARAPLWAERAGPVHTAARAKAAEAAGPDDPHPLAEIIQARLEAAGLSADDPELRFIAHWNTARFAVAGDSQPPGQAGEAEPEAGMLPRLGGDAQCEAES
jgi:hypothetical protein